jgi:predicted RNA-binding protein associated with RNAse of E/G family
MSDRWRPGEVTLVRYVSDGQVLNASAVNVVQDTPERLVLYQPLGAAMQWSTFDFETGMPTPCHSQRRHTTDALQILFPNEAFAVTAMYRGGGGEFWCWYVDMQEPFRRRGGGIVTLDQELDLLIGPDLRWRWKDEDHLARCVELGRYSAEQAAEIRRVGQRVVQRIESRAAPFDEPWPDWRAPNDWPMPELPDDWASLP